MSKKLFKRVAAIAAAMAMTMCSMPVQASAKTCSNSFYDEDVINVVKHQYGDYSTMCSGTGWTGVLSTDSRYDSSYKYAQYSDYREQSPGIYTLKATRSNEGASDFISSGMQTTVSTAVAKRYHYAYTCLTSDKASSKKDIFYCYIYKDTK